MREHRKAKGKEIYEEPKVLATYEKSELEETIRTEGNFDVSPDAN